MFTRPLRLLAVVFGLGVLLAACSSVKPPSGRLPELSFTNLRPYQLNVARVEVVSQYNPPTEPPHIEYDMPISPETALKRWAQDRLKPVGTNGVLRVVIKDATATETPLALDKGVTGMFKKEQAARVDMSLNVSLQMLDEHQYVLSDINASVSRSRSTPEGMKLNERDRLLFEMVEELVQAYNAQVDQEIPTTFSQWLGRFR